MRQVNLSNDAKIMQAYKLEFILHAHNITNEKIKNSLSEFGEDLEISEYNEPDNKENNFKINLLTQDPTVIFDICGQIGRIQQVKIDEISASS